jgi:hypothetical protein
MIQCLKKQIYDYTVYIFLIGFLGTSCSQKQFQSQLNISSELSGQHTSQTPSHMIPVPADLPIYRFEPLAWDNKIRGAESWTNTVYTTIETEEPQLLGQNVADDIEVFCPKYRSLSDKQRLNFWGQLIAGISKYESSWNPATYYVETTMGLDPVTGRQVASEGLLQLSYQDQINYNLDCGFDWKIDRAYENNDSRKSIFNPEKNLRCGIKILAHQLKSQHAISTTTNVYWAVLKKNGTYSKVHEISGLTQMLNFCQ